MNWLSTLALGTSKQPEESGQYLCRIFGQHVVGVYLNPGLPVNAGWYFYQPSDGALLPFQPDYWTLPRLDT